MFTSIGLQQRRLGNGLGIPRRALLLLVFCLLVVLGLPLQGRAATGPKYILFLTADGFRTDYIEWYQPPTLKQLIAEGVRVIHVTNVFPTVTTPNMTSLVTGSYPRTTGIACNSQYQKEDDRIVSKLRDNRAETISETLRKAGWKTAGVNHFMLENRGTDFYRAPGYDDAEKTTDDILDLLAHKEVRFVGGIYGAADHAGHDHGPRSEEVKQAVLGIDRAIGRLVAGLKQQGILDQTLIVFSADHGMSAFEPKQVSMDASRALRQAGFTVATTQEELKAEPQVVVISAGPRLVYFRKVTEAEKQKAIEVLSSIQGAEILGREKLDALGCHNNRSGDLIVNPLPGYTMSKAGAAGGLHGRFAEQNPILFFRGSGVRKGVTVAGASTVDVVPTLLRMVQVRPATTVEGRVIAGVIE
jgi:predicted AlkP superfamily pyrophosphatase or phosphodiesterase